MPAMKAELERLGFDVTLVQVLAPSFLAQKAQRERAKLPTHLELMI